MPSILFRRLLSFVLLISVAWASESAVNIDLQVKGSRWPGWGTESGSGNTYTLTTVAPLGPSLRTGSYFAFVATHANTGAATLAVNGGSAISITKNYNVALASGDIAQNAVIVVYYDGTEFQMEANGFLAPTTGLKRGISFTIGDPNAGGLSASSFTTDYVTVPFTCSISAWNLAIDAGTITVKFWKVATGTAIPTSSNSINTNGVSISSGTAIHSTTLTDFTTTSIATDDIMAMNVTAVSTARFVNGVIECQ